jgi:hypothetical protein
MPGKGGSRMAIWKNGRKPPFIDGADPLNNDKVTFVVNNMTYTGLQTAAACFLMLANKQGLTPCEITKILEGE